MSSLCGVQRFIPSALHRPSGSRYLPEHCTASARQSPRARTSHRTPLCASLPRNVNSVPPLPALPSGKKKKKGLYNIQPPCWRHQVLWRSTRLPRKNRWKRGRFWFNTPRGNFVMKSRAATQNKRLHDMMLIFRMSDTLALWCERCKRNKTPILLLTAQKLDRFFLKCNYF